MDKKQQLKIPGFAWAIAAILVAALLFFIFVFSKLQGQMDTYNRDHASATAQIEKYKDYLNRKTQVEEEIESLKKTFEEKSGALYVNPKTTLEDIRTMLSSLGYDLDGLSVGSPAADPSGKQSATGDPLYIAQIGFNFNASEQKMINTLRYFEQESDGSYYISDLSISPVDGTKEEKSTTAERTYNVSMNIKLYYFNVDENKGLPASALAETGAGTASGASSAASGS